MIQPKISVVTLCYNAVNDIEKTILSVINQTYPNIEYLIIDEGSTDGTMDIVNKEIEKQGWLSPFRRNKGIDIHYMQAF